MTGRQDLLSCKPVSKEGTDRFQKTWLPEQVEIGRMVNEPAFQSWIPVGVGKLDGDAMRRVLPADSSCHEADSPSVRLSLCLRKDQFSLH